ncbi:MAG: hypothetical protein HY298_11535 [Verrucomicrobia bacterium]|nr:hypothetical protein [Verrucomicrobiota bacterium]
MSKVSKKRACPAVGREISSGECGENRQSRYVCPADCVHNPFAPANYSQFLELEGELDHKCMDRLIEHAPSRATMEKAIQAARHDPNPHALHAFYEWQLFFAGGPDGLTTAQRWEKAGFSGLKNDERVLLRAKMQTRLALLEIHRVLDGERVEAVDLLAPGAPAMTFQDRSLAGVAVRFASALTWIYPLPHFWRLSGTAVLLPELAQFSAEEVVTEIVRHLGGPTGAEEMRRWLAENLVRFDDALQATARLRRMKMFAGMDARYGKAVYALQSSFAECRQRLDDVPEVETDQLSEVERQEGFAEARVWFTDLVAVKQAVPPGGRALLGRVLLGQAHWRLEAFGGERFAELRRQFEQCLGERVRLTGERLDDLGAGLAAKEPTVNESLVPPRLLEEPQKILLASSRIPPPPPGLSREETENELMRAADRAFLDDSIPALDNRTPREAAREPALRPRLIRLLKQRVRMHDERNLSTGRTDDINWLLRELGAEEIIFDPPPWRPPLPDTPKEEELMDGADFDDELEPNPSLPPAPPLPATPFSVEEAARRLDAAMAAFDTAAEAEEALYDSGSPLISHADELTVELLSDKEFAFAVPFLLQSWLALVPPGHRAPKLRFADLAAGFDRNCAQLEESVNSGSVDRLLNFSKTSCQPELMLLLTNEILHNGMNAPKQIRPGAGSLTFILALVKSVVDELDGALRRSSLHRA